MYNVDDLESELEDMEGYDPEQEVMDDPETMEDDEKISYVRLSDLNNMQSLADSIQSTNVFGESSKSKAPPPTKGS